MTREEQYLRFWKNASRSIDVEELYFNESRIVIPPGIFNPSPKLTWSTSMVLQNLPEELTDKKVLDMGTGSGVIAIQAALNNCSHVVASDEDIKAIRAAHKNIEDQNLGSKITTVLSDLFHDFRGRFDYIIANLPIIQVDYQKVHLQLLNEYEHYLSDGGELWLVYASFGDTDIEEHYLKVHPNLKEIKVERKFDVIWSIYILTK